MLSLWTAISNLARSLNRLASVADAVAEEAERRVEVSGYAKTPAIEFREPMSPSPSAVEVKGNGRQRKAIAGSNGVA